jgi:hypothetical protein
VIGPFAECNALMAQPSLTGTPVKILNISPPQGGNEVARASIEVAEGIRLHDVKITRTGCVFARNTTFSVDAIRQISDSVLNSMGRSLNANRS